MALTQSTTPPLTFVAGADLSASQFLFVKKDTTAQSVVLAGAGENAIGVLVEPGASGKSVAVAREGILRVYAGAAVTIGNKVMADSAGKAITATSTNHVLGVANTTGATGALMEVIWQPSGILA